MKQMLLLAANVQEETEDKVTHKPYLRPFVVFTLNILNTVNKKRVAVTKSLDQCVVMPNKYYETVENLSRSLLLVLTKYCKARDLDPNAVGLQLGAELIDVVRQCVERYRSGEQCFTIKLRDYETERTRT